MTVVDDFFKNFKIKLSKKDKKIDFNVLAAKAAKYLQSKGGELLLTAKLKGEGCGYYWSESEKKIILVPRRAEYYILPWGIDEYNRQYLFLPQFLLSGVIICVDSDEIEVLGYN